VELSNAAFTVRPVDTLEFCDKDIQARYRAPDGSVAAYFTFEPLLAQLIKESRLLRGSLRKENE